MAGKGLNHFDEYAARCVYLSLHEVSSPLPSEGTVKCTQHIWQHSKFTDDAN